MDIQAQIRFSETKEYEAVVIKEGSEMFLGKGQVNKQILGRHNLPLQK